MNAPPRWLPIVFLALIGIGIALPYVPRPDIDVPFVSPQRHEGAFVVVVEETSQRAQDLEVAKLLNATLYWQGLKQRGYGGFRFYDQDAEDAKPYVEYTKGHKIPTIVILDKDRSVLHSGELPRSQEELDKLLRKVCRL